MKPLILPALSVFEGWEVSERSAYATDAERYYRHRQVCRNLTVFVELNDYGQGYPYEVLIELVTPCCAAPIDFDHEDYGQGGVTGTSCEACDRSWGLLDRDFIEFTWSSSEQTMARSRIEDWLNWAHEDGNNPLSTVLESSLFMEVLTEAVTAFTNAAASDKT